MDMDYAIENSHQEDLDLQNLRISSDPMYHQNHSTNMSYRGQDNRSIN
jgi:hypothetical protein